MALNCEDLQGNEDNACRVSTGPGGLDVTTYWISYPDFNTLSPVYETTGENEGALKSLTLDPSGKRFVKIITRQLSGRGSDNLVGAGTAEATYFENSVLFSTGGLLQADLNFREQFLAIGQVKGLVCIVKTGQTNSIGTGSNLLVYGSRSGLFIVGENTSTTGQARNELPGAVFNLTEYSDRTIISCVPDVGTWPTVQEFLDAIV